MKDKELHKKQAEQLKFVITVLVSYFHEFQHELLPRDYATLSYLSSFLVCEMNSSNNPINPDNVTR